MGAPQLRQRARRRSHERIGTLSHAATAWPQRVLPQLALLRLQWGITYQLAGDFAASTAELRIAYSDAVARGYEFVARNAAGSLALNWALVGESGRAQRWLDTERRHVEPVGTWLESKVRVAGLTAGAIVALDRLDLDLAGRLLEELGGLDEAEELWAFAAYACGRYALLRADAHTGLIGLHREIASHRHMFRSGVAVPLLAATEAAIRLALGEGNQALSLVDELDLDSPWTVPVAAHVYLLTGDTAAALKLARGTDWISRDHARAHVECRIIEAIAALEQGSATAALAWREARQVSWQIGLAAPFAAVPHTIRDRLDEFAVGGFGGRVHVDGTAPLFPVSVQAIRLTDRERVVLDELARGRTVQEAAAALFVSVNTVKTQQRTLYRKLGAHSREEAIMTARRLRLLR